MFRPLKEADPKLTPESLSVVSTFKPPTDQSLIPAPTTDSILGMSLSKSTMAIALFSCRDTNAFSPFGAMVTYSGSKSLVGTFLFGPLSRTPAAVKLEAVKELKSNW